MGPDLGSCKNWYFLLRQKKNLAQIAIQVKVCAFLELPRWIPLVPFEFFFLKNSKLIIKQPMQHCDDS